MLVVRIGKDSNSIQLKMSLPNKSMINFITFIIANSILFSLFMFLSIITIRKELKLSMATQEERLQAIVEAVTNLKATVQSLATEVQTLKDNNPDLEDELSALEGLVATAQEDLAATDTATDTATDEPA